MATRLHAMGWNSRGPEPGSHSGAEQQQPESEAARIVLPTADRNISPSEKYPKKLRQAFMALPRKLKSAQLTTNLHIYEEMRVGPKESDEWDFECMRALLKMMDSDEREVFDAPLQVRLDKRRPYF